MDATIDGLANTPPRWRTYDMTLPFHAPASGRPLEYIQDIQLREALYRLFQRASAHEMDDIDTVIVLVSRRMSCLYEMLLAEDPTLLQGRVVVSDRALQGGLRDLAGRRVLLVDDALILGTTLVDLYDYVVERTGHATLVTVLVACVDLDRYNRNFAEHLGLPIGEVDGPLLRSTKQLEDFAYDIARCLYQAGRPYFTDFPILRSIPIRSHCADAVLASRRWMAADVTPPLDFAGLGRRAYTLIPTFETATLIRSRGVQEAMDLVEGMKVRLYSGPYDEANKVSLRIVPIALPGAVMLARLDEALSALESELGPSGSRLGWPDWRPEAKHRLLQMYVSSCVLTEFWDDLESVGVDTQLGGHVLERSHLDSYFGKDDAEVIVGAFDRAVAAYQQSRLVRTVRKLPHIMPRSGLARNVQVRHRALTNGQIVSGTIELVAAERLDLLRDAVPPIAPEPGAIARIDRIWAHRVLQIFGFVDKDLERPQQEILKNYSMQDYWNFRDTDGVGVGPRVLKQGITLSELSDFLAVKLDGVDTWDAAVVSLAIDIGNDIGIVVPSTTYIEKTLGPIYRQYRSGETAFVANVAHEKLLDLPVGSVLGNLDLFTRAALAELSADSVTEPSSATIHRFIEDTTKVIIQALDSATIMQMWIGEVVSMTPTHFRAVVSSRLVEGETERAVLPRSLLSPLHDQALAVGSVFEWIVFDSVDLLGDPRPATQIRLVPSSAVS